MNRPRTELVASAGARAASSGSSVLAVASASSFSLSTKISPVVRTDYLLSNPLSIQVRGSVSVWVSISMKSVNTYLLII